MDITQEIFIRVLNKIHTFKSGSEKIRSWIYKIAYHYVMSYFKVIKKEQYVCNDLLDYIKADINIEEEIINKEISFNILKTIYKLELKYQEIIFLRYYQDLSIREISEILNCNENTVKTRLSRGLEKLRVYYESGDRIGKI